MPRLCLYFLTEPERDRWVPGDRMIRPLLRRVLRGVPGIGGVEKVFLNLTMGLDALGADYEVNLPFAQLRGDDWVGVIGRGRYCLQGYTRDNPIVAGVALMTHPSEWPTLFEDYPIARYLQHSKWAADVYRAYFGDRVGEWAVGIDTDRWAPRPLAAARYDFLIYDKIRWNREPLTASLLEPVRETLRRRKLTWTEIRYGAYQEQEFRRLLCESRAMIFLCEHESQGLAYQECLSTDVPILAWDQGFCLDPNRHAWGQPEIPATSVPFFDERCGLRFDHASAFDGQLDTFLERNAHRQFAPRSFVLEQLTLEACARRYLSFFGDTARDSQRSRAHAAASGS
jgi:glycosyltransferase involved in cell wall biosynthesis